MMLFLPLFFLFFSAVAIFKTVAACTNPLFLYALSHTYLFSWLVAKGYSPVTYHKTQCPRNVRKKKCQNLLTNISTIPIIVPVLNQTVLPGSARAFQPFNGCSPVLSYVAIQHFDVAPKMAYILGKDYVGITIQYFCQKTKLLKLCC
jgi:hypothetical protein